MLKSESEPEKEMHKILRFGDTNRSPNPDQKTRPSNNEKRK